MLMNKSDFASWTKACDQAIGYRPSLKNFILDCKAAIADGEKARDRQGVAFLTTLLERAEAALATTDKAVR